jgi:hypothetical protein
LMTETSESPVKPVDQANLIAETIAGLRATRLISANDEVVSTWSYRAPYGYPTPSLERDAILDRVIPALEQIGIVGHVYPGKGRAIWVARPRFNSRSSSLKADRRDCPTIPPSPRRAS